LFLKIEQAKSSNKFKGPVVGPVGKYIKIAPGKEDYAQLAELAIGFGMLDRFIVTNDHDRQLLNTFRGKAGCRNECGLFKVTADKRHSGVPDPPADGIETVASVITVTDDLVYNVLGKHISRSELCLLLYFRLTYPFDLQSIKLKSIRAL
jgi:hypothetical protein